MDQVITTNPVPPSGYLSEEAKRKFTLTAGILGGVFFLLQFVLPFIVMLPMQFMIVAKMSNLKTASGPSATFWDGRLWYVEETQGPDQRNLPPDALKFLVPGADDQPQTACSLGGKDAWLLAGGDRLWAISSQRTEFYRPGGLENVDTTRKLGDTSRPFLWQGQPAMLELTPTGLGLWVLQAGQWEQAAPIPLPTGPGISELSNQQVARNLQAVAAGETLHIFLRLGSTLYQGEYPAKVSGSRSEWATVETDLSARGSWQAFPLDGEPAILYERHEEPGFVGVRPEQGSWKKFFTYSSSMPIDIGACATGRPGEFLVLLQSFPGSLRVLQVQDGNQVSLKRYGSKSFGFFQLLMVPIGLMLAALFCLPVLLAFILSSQMTRLRVCDYSYQGRSMRLASLWSRALAQIIDLVFLAGPVAAGYILLFLNLSSMFESEPDPMNMIAGFVLVMLGFLWLLLVLVIFSYLEGRWGVTPGKMALHIRVLGSDLEPCGFGRGLVRNLLTFVDGFSNFLVGILVAALSEHWQRVGDMAARTIVVVAPAKQPPAG